MDFKTKIDLYMKNESIKNLKQLAIKSEIPYTTLRDCYEKNDIDNSRMATMKKLAKYMKCTTDYLGYNELDKPKGILINDDNYDMMETNSLKNSTDGVYISKADGTSIFLKNASDLDKKVIGLSDEEKISILKLMGKFDSDDNN